MTVTVKLFATLRTGRFDVEVRDCPEGSTVGEVADGLGVGGEVSIIFVNSRHAGRDQVLREGDTLALFPPVGGG